MWSRSGTKTIAAVVAIATAVAGCSEIYFDRREGIGPGTGDGLASSKATHMVDPWPPSVANDRIAFNGRRLQAGLDRYNRGRVITPVLPTQTSKDYLAAQQQAASSQQATGQSTTATAAAPVRGANP